LLRLFLASALLLPECAAAAPGPSAERILALPGRLLELPWWPISRALDFAQSHALFERLEDLFYFNEGRTAGWFPNMSSTGSGEGAGILVFHDDLFGKGHQGDAAFTMSGAKQVFASLRLAGPSGAQRRTGVAVDYARDDDAEFYARAGPRLGWDTGLSDRRSHAATRLRARLWRERRLGSLRAGLFGAADSVATGAGVAGLEPPPGVMGFSRRLELGGGGLRLDWDAVPGKERAVRGTRLAAEFEAQAAGDGEHGYARHFVDGRVFVPLPAPRRVLTLRGYWERLHGLGSRRAPFFAYPVLDSDNRLRGFSRLRFRAPGAAALSAEYRYPVWIHWDAFYFIDAGQSYASESELRLTRWSAGHGPGLRFLSEEQLLLTAHVGFNAEGSRFELAMGKVF